MKLNKIIILTIFAYFLSSASFEACAAVPFPLTCPTKQAISAAIMQNQEVWMEGCQTNNMAPTIIIQDQGMPWGVSNAGSPDGSVASAYTCAKMLDPNKYSFSFHDNGINASALLLLSFNPNPTTYRGYNCLYTATDENSKPVMFIVGLDETGFRAELGPNGQWTTDHGDSICNAQTPESCLIYYTANETKSAQLPVQWEREIDAMFSYSHLKSELRLS
ncbi:MAG: hypothetical protein JW855_02690 [Gammaproteobacteria bacterium]|nr:hypothetical protein [Gammaproteobacteria bacterium]